LLGPVFVDLLRIVFTGTAEIFVATPEPLDVCRVRVDVHSMELLEPVKIRRSSRGCVGFLAVCE
jgi:hypothetical protein